MISVGFTRLCYLAQLNVYIINPVAVFVFGVTHSRLGMGCLPDMYTHALRFAACELGYTFQANCL